MTPKHVYIVKHTSYKHGEDDDPVIEDDVSLQGAHLTVQSANNAAMAWAREMLRYEGWTDTRKKITEKDGRSIIKCYLKPWSVHDTDHFVVEVEKVRVEEGAYSDDDGEGERYDDDGEPLEEGDDDGEDEVVEASGPAAKRKRT